MGEPEEMDEVEQVSSDLKSLKTLYGLLHRGPTDETLDETSRAFMTKMLDDITRQTLLRQAKMLSPALERKLSIQSDHRRDARRRRAGAGAGREADSLVQPQPPCL
ncbi:Os04g0601900 [Oryza sativa Japonica Group]|uniref:Os04g0601900 protein n=2 Tax=Oryza sativa TaxID=4530 RepID=A0A0P0WEB7_ORYSJ|nr:Os04g0601900 [Oryza sativa Japonica Group]